MSSSEGGPSDSAFRSFLRTPLTSNPQSEAFRSPLQIMGPSDANISTNGSASPLAARYGQQPNLDPDMIGQLELLSVSSSSHPAVTRLVKPPEVSYEEWQLEHRGVDVKSNPNFDSAIQHASPFSELQGKSTIVAIMTSNEEEAFHVHEHLLIKSSKFFRAALTSGFKESREKKVRLPEANKTSISLFVEWIYTGNVQCAHDLTLVNAYVLGVTIAAPGFSRLILLKLFEAHDNLRCNFTAQALIFVNENVADNDGLRRFMIDAVAAGLATGRVQWALEEWELIGPMAMEVIMATQKLASINFGFKVRMPFLRDYLQ